jgi:hypothetical protein
MPAVEIEGGIMNRVQVGAGYAGGPSLSLKAVIFNDGDKWKHVPAVAIGFKDGLIPKEGQLFGVSDKDTLAAISNNVYLAISKNLSPISSRLHAGVISSFAFESERVNPFWALETYIGGNLTICYEGFQRFEELHHLLTINFKIGDKVKVGFGLTEVSSMFYQNGKTGFFMLGDSNTTGYKSPGFNFSFAFHRPLSAKGTEIGGLEDELIKMRRTIDELSKKNAEMETKVAANEKHLKELEEDITLKTCRIAPTLKMDYKALLEDNLSALVKMTAEGELYEPEAAAYRMKRIVELKELAIPRITELIRNPKSTNRLISLCIQMIGQMGDKQSKHLLVRLLDYKESSIKIEAIIALGKLSDKSVATDLQKALTDTDQSVVLAAKDVIARITGEKVPNYDAVPTATDTLLNLPTTPLKQ